MGTESDAACCYSNVDIDVLKPIYNVENGIVSIKASLLNTSNIEVRQKDRPKYL